MRAGAHPTRPGSVVASRVARAHGADVVLRDVDLTVPVGARLGLVGPNGVGKSTLLRILAGTERPDAGTVTRSPAGLAVGHLTQEVRPLAGETVLDHLARRTGVAAAAAEMDRLAAALADDHDLAQAYADSVEHWARLGGGDLEARAAGVCAELGLGDAALHRPAGRLSGGQTARLGLAAVLLARHDLLLLDEPTNDLDLGGLDRLEGFVEATGAGVVVVSHDRRFLARVVEEVVEIEEHTRRAVRYEGGWDAYLTERARARERQRDAHEAYVAERERLRAKVQQHQRWERVGLARARRSGEADKHVRWARKQGAEAQSAPAKQAQRALERLDRHRAVEKPWEGWELRLEVAPRHRASEVVAELRGAVVERGPLRLGPVDLELRWRDRVAVVGPNGSGKSTLLQTLLGRLPLLAGHRRLGPGALVGELDQHRAAFDGAVPLLDAFVAATGLVPEEARSLLAKLGMGPAHVLRSGATLSPGERTRAQLAVLSATGVNVLVLDEPTNHLDLPAIEQLEEVLVGYEGTVVLVTHDRVLRDRFDATVEVDVTRLPQRWRR